MPLARTLALLALLLACGCAEADDDGEPATAKAERKPRPTPAALLEEPTEAPPAPSLYRVRFEVEGGGAFTIEVDRDWAPHGADRFHQLVRAGFFDGVPFFRVVSGFMVQFGIHPDPAVNANWLERTIPDDPVVKSNRRGYVTFAKTGAPNSRSTQVFINFAPNVRLDRDGFAPFGRVVEGMDVVDDLYAGYGDMQSQGNEDGIDAERLTREGWPYLREFPEMDVIATARVVDVGAEVR